MKYNGKVVFFVVFIYRITSFPVISMQSSINKPKVIIVPGNGVRSVRTSNWYVSIESELLQTSIFSDVILKDMPDPILARESIWIPFIRNELMAEENTILIGHSSGAEAAMRYLEKYKAIGCVLVSACHTDLGMESEAISGYYNHPWNWDKIRENSQWILQYHSSDDVFIPKEEADFVAENIRSEYTCFSDRSHFFYPDDVKHIVPDILRKLNA